MLRSGELRRRKDEGSGPLEVEDRLGDGLFERLVDPLFDFGVEISFFGFMGVTLDDGLLLEDGLTGDFLVGFPGDFLAAVGVLATVVVSAAAEASLSDSDTFARLAERDGELLESETRLCECSGLVPASSCVSAESFNLFFWGAVMPFIEDGGIEGGGGKGGGLEALT